jgi:hypothetical protein
MVWARLPRGSASSRAARWSERRAMVIDKDQRGTLSNAGPRTGEGREEDEDEDEDQETPSSCHATATWFLCPPSAGEPFLRERYRATNHHPGAALRPVLSHVVPLRCESEKQYFGLLWGVLIKGWGQLTVAPDGIFLIISCPAYKSKGCCNAKKTTKNTEGFAICSRSTAALRWLPTLPTLAYPPRILRGGGHPRGRRA